jgi:uncharacterized protein YodC (DUF2158 family)
MNTFKVGDVVQLKSGGPSMTISKYYEYNNRYSCVWFKGDDKKFGMFGGDSLRTFNLIEKDDE